MVYIYFRWFNKLTFNTTITEETQGIGYLHLKIDYRYFKLQHTYVHMMIMGDSDLQSDSNRFFSLQYNIGTVTTTIDIYMYLMSSYIDIIGYFDNDCSFNVTRCPLFRPGYLLHLSYTVTMCHCSLMFTTVLFIRFILYVHDHLKKRCQTCWMWVVYSCGKYLSHLLPNFSYFKYQICYNTRYIYKFIRGQKIQNLEF